MTKIEIGKKYITVSGGVVDCVEITTARVIIRNVYGGGCILDRKWAENNWKSVEPQRLPVVGEIWIGKVNKLPYKILDVDTDCVYSRFKRDVYSYTIDYFLLNWIAPRAAPDEMYLNFYENINKELWCTAKITKEKAEAHETPLRMTIKETAVRYVRAD